MREGWYIWETSNLIAKDTLEIGDGYRAKNSEMGIDGLPFARAGNINNGFHFDSADVLASHSVQKAGNKISIPGDVVFTSKGTIGRFAFVKPSTPQFVYSPQLCYWRVKDATIVDPLYLYYWMQGPYFFSLVHKVKSLTTMADYVSLSDQRKMHIIAPSIHEQKKIAGILSAYDDLIENNTRRIAILEEMARMLYQEWFVNFRFPGHENVNMVESPLGMIPEGWDVVKLGDVCSITMGQSPSSQFYNVEGDGLPFHQGVTDFGKLFPSDRVYCTYDGRVAHPGDILFSVRAPVGRINIANKKIVIGRGISAICSKSGHQRFMFQLLKDKFQEEDIIGNGSIFKAVTKEEINGVELIYPNEEMIIAFEDSVISLLLDVENLLKRNANLRYTRDLLLPRLISGEIDVSSWVEDSPVEEVVDKGEELAMAAVGAQVEPMRPIDTKSLTWHSLWDQ
ncbi:hypothetical protein KDW_22030 [Dictyobacter vulcani]|uniref:Type I restriction modification DNA specificity domain-containing protein n=1 Tax=Dictyobacter vulcani TaxID=2607529 RepID=A0A5J4KNW6_9CHLR|nr:restriction endonuclease subunit S [Dictyobacter vulcani]GER88041.1 hypothetical protein KDW_22030 [Dictyobacter vulcani]